MGRSQVLRNKIHGRPGQTGRGRGAGRGRGEAKRRQDLSKLGDNAHRFEKQSFQVDDHYDGLLDEIHLADIIVESDDLFCDSKRDVEGTDDYLSIDVAGLAKCLEQLPIAERLNLPQHVGKHLEEMYGGGRKKTLAELREDANVQHHHVQNMQPEKSSESTTIETAKSDAAHEDDLEAWLDDMIS